MKKTSKSKVVKKKSAKKDPAKKKAVKKKATKKKATKVKKTKITKKPRKKVVKKTAPKKKIKKAKKTKIVSKKAKKVKKKIVSKAKVKKKTIKKASKGSKTRNISKSDESKGFKEVEEMLFNQRSELLKMISKSSTWEKDISKLEHGDLEDMAATSLEREMTFAMSSREREEIHMINNALKKIAEHTYGKCESCGEKIGIKRLKIVPFAQYCIECKSNMEREMELEGDISYS